MTIPLATIACTIDENGISAPSYADILATLQYNYRSIYGADVDLDSDTQDGQWIAIQATAQNDTNNGTVAAYNNFSPATAQGAGLASNVKLNGLSKKVPSSSTADLTLTGEVGRQILNGMVGDGTYQWLLPATVDIPLSGSIVATATCLTPGAIAAAPGAISQILNPQRGWQTATNLSAAAEGAPVESDAALRQRQGQSTALSASTPLKAIVGAVGNVPGVTAVVPYENDTDTTDGNGIPAHNISLVVEGGDATAVANAIASKKIPGGGTYGTTSVVVFDPAGVPNTINFFRSTAKRVIATITLTPLTGYVSTTGDDVKDAMAAWVNNLSAGGDVALNDVVAAAKLPAPLGSTYKIEYGDIEIAFFGNTPGTADLTVAFNEQAGLALVDITLAP